MDRKYLGTVETQYYISCKKNCFQISGSHAEKIFIAICLVPISTRSHRSHWKNKSSKLESPIAIFLVAQG